MNARCILLLISGLLFTGLFAQKRNSAWIFGNHAGLNFNTNPPSVFGPTAAELSSDFITSISDKAGNLLFYSDGSSVWNKNHAKMPAKGVQWPWSTYVVPLICPYPGNDSLYYLFGVAENLHMLRYLTINIKGGEDGLGEIVYPPEPIPFNYATTLLNDASVMVSATGHCNRNDYWLIAHAGSNLYSYPVTEIGVGTPVISPVSSSTMSSHQYQGGNFKFSANGERMLVPLLSNNKVVVFNFNNLTGQFSNPLSVNAPPGSTLEAAELSPDGSKLYLGTHFVRPNSNPYRFKSHQVLQFDLHAGDAAAIANSKVEINPYPDQSGCTPRICFSVDRTFEVTPDGRIYVSFRTNEPYAHIIQEPNLKGVEANYSLYGLKFEDEYHRFNINSIRSESFEPRTNGINVKKRNCASEPTSLSLIYTNVDSVYWDFGDPASGTNNYSKQKSNEHLYPGAGSYNVTAIIYKTCFTDTAKTTVVISNDKPVKIPGTLKDTTLCLGFEGFFDGTTPFATTYFWSDGLTREPRIRIKQEGAYSLTASNECSRDTRRFNVRLDTCDCRVFIPNAFTPNNDGLNDLFKPATKCFLQEYEFKIYSRLGKAVFATKDRLKGWAGYNGAYMASNGVYAYQLKYKDPNTRKSISMNGTFVLIR